MISSRHITLALVVALLALAWSCGGNGGGDKSHPLPDTLRVGTLYGPTSFFILQGDTLGYEYERVMTMSRDKGFVPRFVVARSMTALMHLLEVDSIDVVAYEIPHTAEFKQLVTGCGAINETHQVLVQQKSDSMVTDVTQLVGREVTVEAGTRYESRLRNLSSEVGGGIVIRAIKADTLTALDLMDDVAAGKLALTVIDSDLARFNNAYYDNLDISVDISFPQRTSWAVRKGDQWLADSIDDWAADAGVTAYSKAMLQRYFEMSKGGPRQSPAATVSMASLKARQDGSLSPYDALFVKYAATINWDWRLLAAIAYVESGFDPTAVSWAGARGLMQIMPGTARAYHSSADAVADPETGVRVATLCLENIEKMFSSKVSDPQEREKFILASYNAGAGHIYDAMALARKHGLDPQVWDGNVEQALMWKSNPEYYNDDVCRFGYFRGKQTVTYVAAVTAAKKRFIELTK